MTATEQKRFERLATAIRRISGYSTPGQLRREYGGGDSGIDYTEALEYAYENMRNEARAVVSLVRLKKPKVATPEAAMPHDAAHLSARGTDVGPRAEDAPDPPKRIRDDDRGA